MAVVSVAYFNSNIWPLQLKNLSAMEVNIVRPFVVRTLQAFFKHDSPEMIQQPETMTNIRPQLTSRGPRVSSYRHVLTNFSCLIFLVSQ